MYDFSDHDLEQEEWLRSRPKCSECKEHIQEDYCFNVDGEILCEDCMNDKYRVCTEDV